MPGRGVRPALLTSEAGGPRNSFRKAIPAFLSGSGSAPLVFHHQGDKVLGRVLELEEDNYGVKLRARVDRQEPTSPLRHLYDAIKRGTLKGLSTGGYFQRAQTGVGRMIADVLRITEEGDLLVGHSGLFPHPTFKEAQLLAASTRAGCHGPNPNRPVEGR